MVLPFEQIRLWRTLMHTTALYTMDKNTVPCDGHSRENARPTMAIMGHA